MFFPLFSRQILRINKHALQSDAAISCLRERRLELGWSRADLAARLGTTERFIEDLESGREDLNVLEPEFVTRLFRVLDCPLDTFVTNSQAA